MRVSPVVATETVNTLALRQFNNGGTRTYFIHIIYIYIYNKNITVTILYIYRFVCVGGGNIMTHGLCDVRKCAFKALSISFFCITV